MNIINGVIKYKVYKHYRADMIVREEFVRETSKFYIRDSGLKLAKHSEDYLFFDDFASARKYLLKSIKNMNIGLEMEIKINNERIKKYELLREEDI